MEELITVGLETHNRMIKERDEAIQKLCDFIVEAERNAGCLNDNFCSICPLKDCELEHGYKCEHPEHWKAWAMNGEEQ